tara:strand:- start:508521 stop:510389 length:1869 start_codon:yes stop_codon:yes gene_type:complete
MIRLLQWLFSSMSLERKCLLLFFSALLVLMFIAFFVVQTLGKGLVKNTTRQRASDYSALELMQIHSNTLWDRDEDDDSVMLNREKLEGFRRDFLNRDLQAEVVGLGDEIKYVDLPPVEPPTDPEELQQLRELESEYRLHLALNIANERPDLSRAMDWGENEAMSRISLSGIGTQQVSAERGPIDGRYIYYTPIWPNTDCLTCHNAVGSKISLDPDEDPMTLANQYPFRVMRVSMPYEQMQEDTTWIQAIVVSMAMLIIAITLSVLHWILRYLVLKPLYHLRDVSDAITHGNTNLRAHLETEDEFRELADAFNRMLRHMTETQDQIQEVNKELDGRVDQLAQLNLQLYEANRLKADFLANMSHELRTPLNSIIGFSDVLQGIDSLTDKQRRYALNIQKSGRLLLEMINDILDLAKVEAGKMELRLSEFDLSRLVSAQCDMIHSLSEEKNISLSVQISDDLRPAYQDPNKLGQIINNLLSNAIKFTPEGGMITVHVLDLHDGRFQLSVRDTGVGIAKEDQDIVFQKFRQSRKVLDGEGLTREFAGTGLGLSIVKELAKLLGGEVDFESELGRGSTFWVRLPWRLSQQAKLEFASQNAAIRRIAATPESSESGDVNSSTSPSSRE